jgi:hypothetical protein
MCPSAYPLALCGFLRSCTNRQVRLIVHGVSPAQMSTRACDAILVMLFQLVGRNASLFIDTSILEPDERI